MAPFARAALALLCPFLLHAAAEAQCEQAKLSPGDAGPFQNFGYSIDVEGDLAVIGSRGSLSVPTLGRAYVYRRLGSGWVEEQVLHASDGVPGNYMG